MGEITTDLARMHEQCVYEQRVAGRIHDAGSRAARMPLYGQIETEYAALFPEHLPTDSAEVSRTAEFEKAFASRVLRPSSVIAEVGPGRCHLAFRLAPLVKTIYGVDVAASYVVGEGPSNFEFRLTDGIRMPFPSNSLDLIVSNQLMEHLHPDDALDQLREIHRVLKPGGAYACVTPNRVNGPHDCSSYFDDLPCPMDGVNYVAVGLHFKEYTAAELIELFKRAGFRSVRTYVGARGHYLRVPAALVTYIELVLQLVSAERRKRSKLLGIILGNRMIAIK
ncbi:MAG: methyltransferase domain-containing protein [Rhodopila sp.]